MTENEQQDNQEIESGDIKSDEPKQPDVDNQDVEPQENEQPQSEETQSMSEIEKRELEEKIKEEERQKIREGQINSYQRKVDEGVVKPEDVPEWIQKELKVKESESSKSFSIRRENLIQDVKDARSEIPLEERDKFDIEVDILAKKYQDDESIPTSQIVSLALQKSGLSNISEEKARQEKVNNGALPQRSNQTSTDFRVVSYADYINLTYDEQVRYNNESVNKFGKIKTT